MNERDLDKIVIEHANGFFMINTSLFELGTQPFVLPNQCEQVFYSQVLNKIGQSYVVRYEPRGRPAKHIAPKEVDNEEYKKDYVQDQVAMSNQEFEEDYIEGDANQEQVLYVIDEEFEYEVDHEQLDVLD